MTDQPVKERTPELTNQKVHKPPHKLRLIIISAVIGVLGGILLIGIPGALVLELGGLAYSFFGISPKELAGDSVWPLAIMISLLWPVPITPLSFFYYKHFPQQPAFNRWLFSLFSSLLATVVVVFVLLM